MTQELGADQLPIGSGRSPDNGVNPQFQSGFNAGYGQAQFDAAQTDAQGAAPLGEHKWFDPECGANGCQSLVWKSRCESAVKGRKDFRAAYKYVLRKLRTAEAQGAAPAGWPPREPTEAMQDAALDEAGWRVEPDTAPRESGVAIESDISADDAASINAECRESLADIWRAMWDAAPPSPALHAPTVEACAIVAEGFNAAVNSKAMKPFAHDPKLVSAVVHRDFAIADAIRALTSGAEAGERGGQTAAARDVLAERERQKSVEGWTTEHDDEHDTGDLARAAAAYARHAGSDEDTRQVNSGFAPEDLWPSEWGAAWKPSTRRCDLVKAGALILAEIERLDRASVTPDRGASTEPRPVPAKAEPCPTCKGKGGYRGEDRHGIETDADCDACDGTGKAEAAADAGEMERLAREEAERRFGSHEMVIAACKRSAFTQGALWLAALRPAPTEEQVERAAKLMNEFRVRRLRWRVDHRNAYANMEADACPAEMSIEAEARAILAVGPAPQAGAGR
jgi:hypothetical protein